MLLDVQHISKSFTTGYIRKVKKEVLKDISFTLSKGETLGIAGTSGAGKTTLIRILMQLLVPDGGVVLYHGRDLGELSGKEMLAVRRTMQMIFQNPVAALHPRMTIRQSIEEPSRLYGKMIALRSVCKRCFRVSSFDASCSCAIRLSFPAGSSSVWRLLVCSSSHRRS